MTDFTKPNKLGEIEFSDQHYLVQFNIEDKPYIKGAYIDPIISLNDVIDTLFWEIYSVKGNIDRMVHYKDNKKKVWSYSQDNFNAAASYYASYERLGEQLDNILKMKERLMNEFHTNLQKTWNDNTVQDKHFEPTDVSKADDLVPLPGVAQAAKQITHETFRTWDFFGLGRSEIPPAFDDQFLHDEIGRYFIKTHGSLGAIGEVIRLLVVSPDDLGSENISEVCVADSKTGGNILFRTVLEKKVHHEAGQHFLATSANIYLVSRR